MTQLILVSSIGAFALAAAIVPIVGCSFRQLGFVDQPDRERKLPTEAVSLRGSQKLLFQLLVVVAVIGSGTVAQKIGFFATEIDHGNFAFPITLLWLLAAINALKLIDGADGMTATAGAIISGGLAVLCLLCGSPLSAIAAAALAGSLLGFLLYNRPPASTDSGDAGSMAVGLFIGVISIWSSGKGSMLLSVAPLFVLTIPLFDSLITRAMLFVVSLLCGITALSAILSVYFDQRIIALAGVALAGVALVLSALVFTRSYGDAELRMLASRTSHVGESLNARSNLGETASRQRSVRLQGNRCGDAIWTPLVEVASDRGFTAFTCRMSICIRAA